MKLLQIIPACLIGILALQPSFAGEDILPWDALNSEKQFRSTVESRFPDLHFGFYHYTGDWMLAALEDFDRDRVLLLVPVDSGTEKVTLTCNGKEITMPPGEPVILKVASALTTPEGKVSDKENAVEHTIGYWINLEATDTLSLVVKPKLSSKGEFNVTYDPDSLWKTSLHWKNNQKDKKKPADAYEISRKSLLKRVLEVLAERNNCLVRLKLPTDLIITTHEVDKDSKLDPLYTALSDKIEVGIGEHVEVKSATEYDQLVELYTAAARTTGESPRITIEVNAATDDQIFRTTLNILAKHQFSQIRLILKEADKK